MKNIIILLLMMFSMLSAYEEPMTFEQAKKICGNEENISIQKIQRENRNEPLINASTGYDMVIITDSTLYNMFVNFADIKNEEGIRTIVVTTAQTGNDTLSIRNWLKNQIIGTNPVYPDLKYVLIGGDETIVPITTIPFTSGGYDKSFSTDYYYSNVLHSFPSVYNWVDMYSIDLSTDLIVGRIPARTPVEVLTFINKYSDYYSESRNYASDWKFITSNLGKYTTCTDASDAISEIIPSLDGLSIDLTTENDLVNNTLFDSTQNNVLQGSMERFINEINEDNFSLLYTINHGTEENFVVGDYQLDRESATYRQDGHDTCITNNESFAAYGIHNQWIDYPAASYYMYDDFLTTPRSTPYVHFLASCETANFSGGITTPIAQSMFLDEYGPVYLQSSSFIDLPQASCKIREYVFDNTEYGEVGKLNQEAWELFLSATCHNLTVRALLLSETIFGDPSMRIWSDYNGTLKIKERNNVLTAIDYNGNAVSNALIVILDDNGDYVTEGVSPYTYTGTFDDDYFAVANCANYSKGKYRFSSIYNNAKPIYTNGFENGLDIHWDFQSTVNGRILLDTLNTPHSDSYHLVLDSYKPNWTVNNSAVFHADLADRERVFLEFWWKQTDSQENEDNCLAVSLDGGINYYTAQSFDTETTGVWTKARIDMDKFCTLHELTYTDDVMFKFSNECNQEASLTGLFIDDLKLETMFVTPEYFCSFPQDEFDAYWSYGTSDKKLGIVEFVDNSSDYAVRMSQIMPGKYSENYVQLYADLSGSNEYNLNYKFCDFGENNHNQDGVYFSNNGGVSFTKVHTILSESFIDCIWNNVQLNINSLCNTYNIAMTHNFVIRFVQYDDSPYPNGGYMIDDVEIEIDSQSSPYITDAVNESVKISSDVYPNPFNPDTRISFSINTDTRVNVSVYNIKGQKVTTLIDKYIESGKHEVIWKGKDDNNKRVSSGVYFYRISTPKCQHINKMLLLK